MKKISIAIMTGAVVLLGSSCQKYLDINHNPNQATSSTPDVVLPQAITYTASAVSGYNDYGSQLVGYMANAGGYGGFGSNWTYDFGPNDYAGLWSTTYDALEDLEYVITSTKTDSSYQYFNAAARIMKVYNFELLVDTYNNVPYFGALQGTGASLTPKYDDAKAIYQDMALQLDSAITTIETVQAANVPGELALSTASDPLFGGNMTTWIQFANTLKLRLFIRASSIITFSDPTFDNTGFLTQDAVVNPGFQKATGQQNPSWNTWVQSYTGGNGNRAWMPCTFSFGFYNGATLTDSGRGKAIYYLFTTPNGTPNNQLGDGLTGVPFAPATTNGWYSSVLDPGSSPKVVPNVGVMKGPDMGEPLMLAAESYFLQAEGNLRGIVNNTTPSTAFYSGILASYLYLYEGSNLTLRTDFGNPIKDDSIYLATNSSNYLVNFSNASGPAQQLEAIITQKYIALNMISGAEAWNEYRRTLYPKIINGATGPNETFASLLSQSSRPDKLPSRILYPANEYSYNAANVPTGISPYTSNIFWAQ